MGCTGSALGAAGAAGCVLANPGLGNPADAGAEGFGASAALGAAGGIIDFAGSAALGAEGGMIDFAGSAAFGASGVFGASGLFA